MAVHFEATTPQGNPPSTAPIYIIRRMPNGSKSCLFSRLLVCASSEVQVREKVDVKPESSTHILLSDVAPPEYAYVQSIARRKSS
jgi:hypothetical protein